MLRRLSLSIRLSLFASVLCFVNTAAEAQAPAGYYSSVNTSNSSTLRSTLHQVIDDHQRFPYTASGTDTWNILELADEDPNNSSRVLDVYKNGSHPKMGGGSGPYNREHTWPSSYGFPDDGGSNYPFTDCHQLFLCDTSYNSSRSNHPFRDCNSGCGEFSTDFNDGVGGGSGPYPGNSNWRQTGSGSSGTWEVWGERRGDIARAQFYMDLRYEGGNHNGTGASEPNLILTNNESLIAASNTGNNESTAYMGMLSVLLQWHLDDPVDAREMMRNDVVYSFQGNRNPFVDHPEWVDCLFNNVCAPGDMTAPAVPTGVSASASSSLVALNWNNNTEPDLAGYRVYRSVNNGGPYGLITAGLLAPSAFNDSTVVNGTTYYYVVTAEDTSGNESFDSVQVSGTPMTSGGNGGSGDPWINEFHYDNSSGDTGEFVEIAGPEGLNLNQWKLVAHNGNGGAPYDTVNLSGVFQDQQDCIGTLSFAFDGLQNGGPDGIALVDPQGQVIEFLSYEGMFTATGGDANGMTSTNIGVSESGSTPVGHSLQLGGSGADAVDFTWQSAQVDTPGLPNAGQSFVGGCVIPPTPPAAPTGLLSASNEGSVNLSWSVNTEPDILGYNVYRSLSSGSGYAQLNGPLLQFTAFFDPNVTNGVTYFYVVTAENTAGLESVFSAPVQANPVDVTAPAVPIGLGASGLDALVVLDWDGNTEGDLAGYNIYRSLNIGGPFTQLNGGLVILSSYNDNNVVNGVEYFYQVSAVDQSTNESPLSLDVNATPEDITPPASPSAFRADTGNSVLSLDWLDSPRGDLAGYNVYRAENAAGPYVQQNLGLLFVSEYADSTVVNGRAYYYYATAVDFNANESSPSLVDGAVAFASPKVSPWINEIHYQNTGNSVLQSIEIAGEAGVSLSNWQVLLYSRSGHYISQTTVPPGVLMDSGSGFGTRQVPLAGMDKHIGGIVLVDSTRKLRQFISYNGVIRALNGPAIRSVSTDIGVREGKFTSPLQSLQLVGTGSSYFDFTWKAGVLETFGQSNADQIMLP